MSERELITQQSQPPHLNDPEGALSSERLIQAPRLLIYGGPGILDALELADALEGGLAAHGIEDARISILRDVTHVEDAFYGRRPPAPARKALQSGFPELATGRLP